MAEDRELFKAAMEEIGLKVPRAGIARSVAEAEAIVRDIGMPVVIRPSFTLGGQGGGIAYNPDELRDIVGQGLDLSPNHQVLVEECVIGWKEFELEVMRDLADNVIIICSIENVDPMGVHTGDSVTVAPAQTLSDVEYQDLRDIAIRIIRRVGVDTGGSNIQFAINPADGEVRIIEMNPRVSRSSALASKATGFPIAKIAAQLAVGLTLDEIRNDITRVTPASFEPSIDYVIVKIPRWNFEKFPGAERGLGTAMKSVGEVMGVGRTFNEAMLKAIASLEGGFPDLSKVPDDVLREKIVFPTPDRLSALFESLRRGVSVAEVHGATKVDPWFLDRMLAIIEAERTLRPDLDHNSKTNQVSTSTTPAKTHKVNINTASRTDLEAIPGIGPSIADAIIAARPFKSIAGTQKRQRHRRSAFWRNHPTRHGARREDGHRWSGNLQQWHNGFGETDLGSTGKESHAQIRRFQTESQRPAVAAKRKANFGSAGKEPHAAARESGCKRGRAQKARQPRARSRRRKRRRKIANPKTQRSSQISSAKCMESAPPGRAFPVFFRPQKLKSSALDNFNFAPTFTPYSI